MAYLLLFMILLFLMFPTFSISHHMIQYMKSAMNSDFADKKILETPIKSIEVESKLKCVVVCTMTYSCLSVDYNEISSICLLFDRDFITTVETTIATDVGWNYRYIVQDHQINNFKERCNLQSTSSQYCLTFCFSYINRSGPMSPSDVPNMCAEEEGEVIKVNQYLKQFCMQQAIDPVVGDRDKMLIQGMQNENTGEWTYFDGTKMTFFYWDNSDDQPSYKSPLETPGKYEGLIGTSTTVAYRWHDFTADFVTGAVCEIKS